MIDIYLGSYMYTHRRCTLLDYIDTQRAREMRGAIYDATNGAFHQANGSYNIPA